MNYRYLYILGLCALLTACGFHLRGFTSHYPSAFTGPIAIQVTHADKAWEPLLRQQLNQTTLRVVNNLQEAQYWITILNETSQNTIVSISSSSSPRQYELIYSVTFSVQNRNTDLIAPTTLYLTRPITMNNDRILGSHDEENKLTQDIRREAAIQILDRMNRRAWSTLIESPPHVKD